MQDDTLLEVRNLRTEFHMEDSVITAVNGVDFRVKKGETLGIVGESGSGKSVTALSIMRLVAEPPGKIAEGQILFNDIEGETDLLQLSEDEIRHYRGNKISMIFQEPMTSLNPVFTCGFQVLEAIVLHQKVSKKKAIEMTLKLFEDVQLPDPPRILAAYPHQLSGGQKQRVMIAMAMSCNPSMLIADVPTTALDVTVQKTILELMIKLKNERDMSIMFITHDLVVIAEIADKVIVMYKGNIVEQGDIESIFTNPQHPYTKGLLACRPSLDKKVIRLPVISDFMGEDENGNITEKAITVEEVIQDNLKDEEEFKKERRRILNQDPILSVRNLKTYFTTKTNIFGKPLKVIKAVDDVSFDVFPGETLGLVGESGCGKTTLGRTILQLVPALEGEIVYNGVDLMSISRKDMRNLRKNMQIIFQDPYSSLNPRLTVGAAIMEPLHVHKMYSGMKERKEKVMELLEKVNMQPDHFNRYPHEFSGGQRQRICIARALALKPNFIICDESVSALDVSVQAQVLNLLNSLKKEFGFTYIFISHDLSVVKFMSDRMMVMNQGKIEELGFSENIYYNPQKEYTKKLIDAIPSRKFHSDKGD